MLAYPGGPSRQSHVAFLERGGGRFDAQRRGEDNVSMEAETGTLWPQSKDCWHPPEAGKGKEWILP